MKNEIIHCFLISLPRFHQLCGLKSTGKKIQTKENEGIYFLIAKTKKGEMSSSFRDHCVKSNENEKLLFEDAQKLYSLARPRPPLL